MAADAHRRAAAGIRRIAHDDLVNRHARPLRKALIRSAADAPGGNRRQSGMGDRPTLGVRMSVASGNRTTTVTLTPSPKAAKAPWRWIDTGTESGQRAKRRTARPSFVVQGRELQRTRRDAQITGVGAYFHPGTDGDGAWSKPTAEALPRIRDEMRAEFRSLF